MSAVTDPDTYFEDYEVGQRMRHARGKTVTALENVLITNLALNTADVHFNEHRVADRPQPGIVVFGGVTAAVVIGIASQDASSNVVSDLGLFNMKLLAPVTHGDTLYAYTEVVAVNDASPTTGRVVFHHTGAKPDGTIVFEADRHVEVAKRDASPSSEKSQKRNDE